MLSDLSGPDWLLLLIAAGDADSAADPIRIMKGAFLISEELRARGLPVPYQFAPYHYGPFTSQVYTDLEGLVAQGLLRAGAGPRESRWQCYLLEPAALPRAQHLRQRIGNEWAAYIDALRRWLDEQTFTGLLQFIYKRYPEYAKATVLPHLVGSA